jgi:hypothetical protein
VRWETPYLAYFQSKVRTPALDSYFAITANLGTLTFFMVGLPILIWSGYPNVTKLYDISGHAEQTHTMDTGLGLTNDMEF